MTRAVALQLLMMCVGLGSCATSAREAGREPGLRELEETLKRFNEAMVAEDAAPMPDLLYAQGDHDGRLAAAHARRVVASVRFARALSRFPTSPNALYERHRVLIPSDWQYVMLGGGWGEIRGNHTVVPPDEAEQRGYPVPSLVRIRGTWKIDVTPPPPTGSIASLADAVDAQARIITDTASGIESGRLASVEQVAASLSQAPRFAPSDMMPDMVLALPQRSE